MKHTPHHQLRVAEVIVETADARSFVLDVPDELADRFGYRAGQFLTVRVPGPGGTGFTARCYSLSSSPLDPERSRPTITVKRMADGHGSNWLCDNVSAGTELSVLPPAGTFTARTPDADFLMFAAGSGITPVMSLLRSALIAGSGQVVLIYANRDRDSVIFAAELDQLATRHRDRLRVHHWLETGETGRGRPNAEALGELAAPYLGHEIYVCGPEPFMVEAVQAVKHRGVPHGRIHVERFVSLSEDPFGADQEIIEDEDRAAAQGTADGDGVPAGILEVELDGERHTLPWPSTARMLDVLQDSGLAAPSSCRQGRCGACTCRLEKGEITMVANEVLDEEDLAEGYILACQSLPLTETVRITYS